jgi:hypothetical protein
MASTSPAKRFQKDSELLQMLEDSTDSDQLQILQSTKRESDLLCFKYVN